MEKIIKIEGGRIIDPATGKNGNADIRIEGNLITAVDMKDAAEKAHQAAARERAVIVEATAQLAAARAAA